MSFPDLRGGASAPVWVPWVVAAVGVLASCAPGAGGPKATRAGVKDRASVATLSQGANRSPADPEPAAVVCLHPRLNEPWLGTVLERGDSARSVLVRRIVPNSPAQRAGLMEQDVLATFDREQVATASDVTEQVLQHGIKDRVVLGVRRSGVLLDVEVELEAAPHPEDWVRLLLVNRPAPEIAGVVAFQGEIAALGDVRGQVLVLEFWGSYCPPCLKVGEIVQALYTELRAQGLAVLAITSESALHAAEVAERRDMRYPLASDTTGKVQGAYFAREIPMVVLVDRRGVVKDVFLGYDPERLAALPRQIDLLLRQDP